MSSNNIFVKIISAILSIIILIAMIPLALVALAIGVVIGIPAIIIYSMALAVKTAIEKE